MNAQRCDHRNANDGSYIELHDHRDRWPGCYRRTCVQRHHQRSHNRESSDIAEWHSGVACQTVSATGGTGAYTFSVSVGSLPAGLSLNAGTGAITGTPTTAATSNFTITATDGLGATGARAYSVTMNAGVAVNPATLPNGTVGVAYSQTVSATGGNGSYTFSVSAGSLPAGLSLNAATGAITGTPTAAATSNFTITATDGLGATGARAYSVTINAAITVNPATLPNGTVGTAYSQTVSATGQARARARLHSVSPASRSPRDFR